MIKELLIFKGTKVISREVQYPRTLMAGGSWRVPTPVQELATGVVEPPSQFVLPEQDRPAGLKHATDMPVPIPVIDLSRLPDADEAAKLQSSLQSWGLFLVTNHGIEASLMDAVMDATKEFFRQPLEEKQRYTNIVDGKHFQLEGYGKDQVLSEDQILDWNDRLYLKVEPEDERNLALWPTHLRDVLHEYTAKCTRLKDCLLPAMAKLLELEDDYFSNQYGDKANTYARFNYCPRCLNPDLVFGLSPHSDGGLMSLLMVDNSVGGLQVLIDEVWCDVPTRPYTLLINLGDQMEIMSNGIFKSPVHRVVTNSAKERLSVVLFYSIDPEKEIQPAGELIDENHPALYKKMKVKDYIAGLFDHFSQRKMIIETAKI